MKSFILCIVFTLLSCQAVFPLAVSKKQDDKPTPAEKKAALELAAAFARRMDETGDVKSLFGEFFADDFIERYIKEQKKQLRDDSVSSNHIYFVPGIDYNSVLLDKASVEDWKRFFAATFDFLNYGADVTFNKSAKYMLKGQEPPDKILNDMYPAEIIKTLDENPILNNFVIKKQETRPVATVEEMRSATAVLEQSMKSLSQEKGEKSAKLNEEAKNLLHQLDEKGGLPIRVEVTDEEYFGFPKGTRIISVPALLSFRLLLVNIDGKYKIIWAGANTDD